MRSTRLWGALAAGLLGMAPIWGIFEVEDQVDLVVLDRHLIAVAGDGDLFEAELELEERVELIRSDGLLAVAATTSRLLGATADSATFKVLRLRIEERERPPADFLLQDRVAVVPLDSRVAALASTSAGWSAFELGTRERVTRIAAESQVAVVVTDRRVVGFAPESGGFVEIALGPRETPGTLSLQDRSVTLVTDRRVLVFQAGAPRWIERIRTGRD